MGTKKRAAYSASIGELAKQTKGVYMAQDSSAYKDEATEELENLLTEAVRAAVQSELGPIIGDHLDDVRRDVRDVRSQLERCDKEAGDNSRKLEATLCEKLEFAQDHIERQVLARLNEDRSFLNEAFARLPAAEELRQLLEYQADTRSTVHKGVRHISAKMAENGEAQTAELQRVSESWKKLRLLVTASLVLSGLAAATSLATLLWNVLS